MTNICIKEDCNNERHVDGRYCIFHCNKKDFSDQNITLFWNAIREKYPIYDGTHNFEPIEFIDIKFPNFESISRSVRYPNNFFRPTRNYRTNKQTLKFINCIFLHDFDLCSAQIKHIIFDNCIFHGDLNRFHLQTLEIINSEFKNEVSFEGVACEVLNIKENSEFKKDVKFVVTKSFNIMDVIFKGDFTLIGENECSCTIEKSNFNKIMEIANTDRIIISDIKIKSNLSFVQKNNNIQLKNITFPKNVNFNDSITNVVLDKVEINTNISLKSLSRIEIKNSSLINGNLKLNDVGNRLGIYDSNICKKIDASFLKNVDIENSTLNDKFTNIGDTNDFKIGKSHVKDLELCTTNTIVLSNTTLNGLVNLFGDNYTNVTIENCTSTKELLFNNITENLTISKLLGYPSLKLVMSDYKLINVDNSRLLKFTINKAKNLFISKSIIKDEFIIEEDINHRVTLDNTKFKKECEFPAINDLIIKNKCIFSKDVSFDKIEKGNFSNAVFTENVKYISESEDLKFEDCNFKKLTSFSSTKKISFENSEFNGDLIFFEAILDDISFHDTCTETIDFKRAIIKKISFNSSTIENPKTIINGNADFSYSKIYDIKINNTLFCSQVLFNQLSTELLLDNCIHNTTFEDKLLINQTTVQNLFSNSENVKITHFDLTKSILQVLDDTTKKSSLLLKNVKINIFKIKDIIFEEDVNFQNLEIDKLIFTNSNIETVFRIKNCFIKDIESEDNIFEDLQLVDNQYNSYKDIKRNISFQNTTIKNAVFDKLKFDEFKMNDAHVSSAKIGYVEFEKASRETNRFFKNYYDSISDFVTANKYYAREMLEQQKISKGFDKFIFSLNKVFSDFGQSWMRPLILMTISTLFFYRIANFDLLSLNGFMENHITWMMNDILKFSNPFSKTSTSNYGNMYWAWLVHKLFMTVLIYHFVVAIKRRTKR